jgi:hypothetical protein
MFFIFQIESRLARFHFAVRLAKDLKISGVNLWMDRLEKGIEVGDDWVQVLQDAINNCAAFIAVLSPNMYTPNSPSEN